MLKDIRILIVDDDERNIIAMNAVLQVYKAQIFTARDGRECLKQLKLHNEIDIILLDMMMPEFDGYQVLDAVRKDEKLKHLPIIAITAQAMSGDKEKCISAGADDYCAKPVNIDKLLQQILKLIRDRKEN